MSIWAQKNGVKYPSISTNNGGLELQTQFYNGKIGNVGLIFLIYPDKTFIGADKEDGYGVIYLNHKSYNEFLQNANISKDITTTFCQSLNVQSSNVILNKISGLANLSNISDGVYSIEIYQFNGRSVYTINNKLLSGDFVIPYCKSDNGNQPLLIKIDKDDNSKKQILKY